MKEYLQHLPHSIQRKSYKQCRYRCSRLNYYYFISLLASALTMWYLRKTTDDAKLLAKLEENYKANKNNPNKKVSGLAARLEALQKQQEALMEAQKRKNNQ